MALAKIVVPLAVGTEPTAVLDLARRAAHLTSGRVEVMCVRRDALGLLHGAIGRDAHLWTPDLMRVLTEAADHQRAVTREGFDGWMRSRHVTTEPQLDRDGWQPGIKWTDHAGNIERLVAQLGRFSELIVLDGRAIQAEGEASAWPVLEAALFDARRPVLIAADGGRSSLDQSALVAWDGSAEALHALQAALPILSRSIRITLMTLGQASAIDPVGETALLDWLTCHGIFPERRFVETCEGTVGHELLRQAAACGADLIVMGAFTHSRLSESVFGGTTRHVLERSQIPILLSH